MSVREQNAFAISSFQLAAEIRASFKFGLQQGAVNRGIKAIENHGWDKFIKREILPTETKAYKSFRDAFVYESHLVLSDVYVEEIHGPLRNAAIWKELRSSLKSQAPIEVQAARDIAGALGWDVDVIVATPAECYLEELVGGVIEGEWGNPLNLDVEAIALDSDGDGAIDEDVLTDSAFRGVLDLVEIQFVTPLVLDLDGDGIELTSVEGATAFFDLDVNGFAAATGWVAADDGLLALDVDGNGRIDNGAELFGDQTGQDHGFLALAQHDGNGDEVIDAQDAIFADLVIWQDLNADGISQADEMRGLVEVGIASISVQAKTTNYWVEGNEIRYESSFTWDDGTTGLVGDAFFAVDPIRTTAVLPDDFEFHPDVSKLPVITGAGSLASTWVAMTIDPALRQSAVDLVELASGGDIIGFYGGFLDLIYGWAGVADVPAGSRGKHVDARSLAFMETLTDRSFSMPGGDPNPAHWAAQALDDGFAKLAAILAAKFLSQTAVSNALLNAVDADSYAAILDGSPLSGLGNLDDPAIAAAPILDAVEAGALDALDAGLLLHITSHRASDGAAWLQVVAEMAESMGASARAAAAFSQSIDQGKFLQGQDSVDALNGSEDYGKSIIFGDAGDDYLRGGRWDSTTYLYRAGDGSDTVHEGQDGGGYTGMDRLLIDGFSSDDVKFLYHNQSSGAGLHIEMADGEIITVIDQFSGREYELEEIVLADGAVFDRTGIKGKFLHDQKETGFVWGTNSADHYVHTSGDGSYSISDPHSGTAVSPSQYDTLTFTDIAFGDVILGAVEGDGDQQLDLLITVPVGDPATSGATETIRISDQLSDTDHLIETISFSDGVTLGLTDLLSTVAHSQKATGVVYGSKWDETYVHAEGDGSYEIRDYDGTDTLNFGDLNQYDVTFSTANLQTNQSDEESLVLTTPLGDTISVFRQFNSSFAAIEKIVFADGAILSKADIAARVAEDEASEVIAGTSSDDFLVGLQGRDTINAGDGDDVVSGGAHNDVLRGELGNDTLDGGLANDLLEGGAGDDSLVGGAGNDTIWTSASTSNPVGRDIAFGNEGDDILHGSNGRDTLYGGTGDDTLTGGNDYATADQDELFGGDGNDLLISGQTKTPTEARQAFGDKLYGEAGNDTLEGGLADDLLDGGDGADVLTGGAGSDSLYGQNGSDYLDGGEGADFLGGGTGGDTLVGGKGTDTLKGGGGLDVFVFFDGDGHDIIKDFSMEHSEKIDLSAVSNTASTADLIFDSDGAGSTILRFDRDADGVTDTDMSITLTGVTLTSADADQFLF